MHDGSSNAVDRTVPREGLEEWFAGSRRTLSVLAILVLTTTLVVGISSAEADDLTEFTFSGTVTAADSGAALSGMKVSIFCTYSCEGTHTDPQNNPARPWPIYGRTGTNLLGEATTDSSGNWSLTLVEPSENAWPSYRRPPTLTVVWDADGDYGIQLASPTVSVGDEVVSLGTTAELEEGGRLSGTITGDGATPLDGEYLLAFRGLQLGLSVQTVTLIVGADGSYATPSLPNGTYYITYPRDLSQPYVSGATYTLGSISDGEDTASDHQLFEYATVSGRVTDGSGNGLSGIRVSASPTGGSAQSFTVTSLVGGSSRRFETLTDRDGNYSYDSAVPGTAFTVEFSSSDGEYATEYYDDKTNLDEADGVEIPRRGDVPNIDAQLRPGSTVSGSVIEITEEDPTGAPRRASVYLCSSNDHCHRTSSNSAGFFKLGGLNAATYSLTVRIFGATEAAETTVELSEGTERYFVAVLDGDDSEITEPQDDASDTFEDIADGAHYESAVAWMIRHEITTGCNQEPALFCPDSDLTRAQFVTFLWRASGKPEPSIAGSEVFGDVAAGHFADQAIGWAKEADVTTGCAQATETTEARFCIDSPVKRGQIATFLHRFVEEPESTVDHGLTDIDQGRYFSEPVAWTAEHMFVDGCSSTRFCPDDDADRATAAVFIHGVATNPGSWANRTSDFQYG